MSEISIFQRTTPEQMALLPEEITSKSILDSPRAMAHLGNIASAFASSQLVPEHYRGKVSEIFIALQSARTLGVDPMMYLQSTSIISGKPAMATSMVVSLLKAKKLLLGTLKYETDVGEGSFLGHKNYRCRAWGVERETNEKIYGPWVDMAMVVAEGWSRNAKYKSMPEVMLEKRAATFFVRRYFPEVLNGLHDDNELQDIGPTILQNVNTPDEPVFEEVKQEKANEVKEDQDVKSSESEQVKPGSIAWYKQELDSKKVKYAKNSKLADLKALLSSAIKKEKEREGAEDAVIIKGTPEKITIPEAEQIRDALEGDDDDDDDSETLFPNDSDELEINEDDGEFDNFFDED